MFNHEELTDFEREIILLLGDHVREQPIPDPVFKMKFRKHLYKEYFSSKMSIDEFESKLKRLFFKGLITYSPSSITQLDNTYENKKAFEKANALEKEWESSQVVRLTQSNERTITGYNVYDYLVQENLANEYRMLSEKNNQMINRIEGFEGKISHITNQYVGAMAIFIAIFIFISSNTGFISDFASFSTTNNIFLLLITNGTILFSVGFLLFLVKYFIFNRKMQWGRNMFVLLFPTIIFIAAFLVKYYIN